MANKTKWVLDKVHSELAFKVKHMMITNVKGIFNDYDAEISTVDDDFKTAEINLNIKASSIDTNDTIRDNHLKSADFFDAEKFNEIKFKSKSLKLKKDNLYELTGELTIKNITKTVKFDAEFGGIVKDPWGNIKAGFTLEGKINRKDWELNWNSVLEAGGVLVGEEVKIMCEAELLKSVQ
jgi:polyisoprenoid-binding protein YceI